MLPSPGYPIRELISNSNTNKNTNNNSNNKWLRKDEVRLPNGTVVGKYMYYDKDGAAVDVKYYADDVGYG